MKVAKKIDIRVTVKDNPFLKRRVPYLKSHCDFLDSDFEPAELVELTDSDEFIITLTPVTRRDGELIIVDGEFQYKVGLMFKGKSMTGIFYGSYEPYALLLPSEVLRLIFPTSSQSDAANVIMILNMVFGLNGSNFKYEII